MEIKDYFKKTGLVLSLVSSLYAVDSNLSKYSLNNGKNNIIIYELDSNYSSKDTKDSKLIEELKKYKVPKPPKYNGIESPPVFPDIFDPNVTNVHKNKYKLK